MEKGNKKIIAIIPARGGSKRIPGKNIRLLAGKPLIAHTIEAAKQSKYLDRVLVSTDSEEIANVSKQYGAEVMMRPTEISGDHSTTEEAMIHLVNELKKQGYDADIIVLLQCTCPVRGTEDTDKGIKIMLDTNCDSVLSVTENQHYYLAGSVDKETLKYVPDYDKRPMSHNMPSKYKENGAIYITKVDKLLEAKNRIVGDVRALIMDTVSSIDIDDESDFKMAERIIK
tara:strand:- start:138 stop:821 length:684 start_codon:yes stop_codon:yes gene_type:complete